MGAFMQVLQNYDDNDKFTFGHSRSGIIEIDFHLHDGFEIFYLISGDVNYFVEKKIYELKPGDLIITNKYEIHKPYFKSDKVYERIIIQFSHEIPGLYSTGEFDLLNCFNNREKGERNRIQLNHTQLDEMLELFNKIERTGRKTEHSDKILRDTYFVQLLVLLNKAFLPSRVNDGNTNIPVKISPILDYINENLQGDLSLEFIEQRFFINKYYLSRLFKKNTGINLHQYIIYKRLARAKELLAQGVSVTDACYMTGFNDYSNFIRIFKKIIGVSPGLYRKMSVESV